MDNNNAQHTIAQSLAALREGYIPDIDPFEIAMVYAWNKIFAPYLTQRDFINHDNSFNLLPGLVDYFFCYVPYGLESLYTNIFPPVKCFEK